MATVSAWPSPALNRAVQTTIGHAPLHRGMPLSNVWRSLTRDLSEDEAESLGQSMGLALKPLAGDQERVRLAADLAVAVDAYEAVHDMVDLLDLLPLSSVALAAAALASHPGTSTETVSALRRRDAVSRLSGDLRRAFDIRLDPSAPAETDHQRLLRLQRWPGVDPGAFAQAAVAPVVAIAEQGLPHRLVWRLVTALQQRGAAIRRIPREVVSPPQPGWLGPNVPIVASSASILEGLRGHGQDVTGSQVVVVNPAADTMSSHLVEVTRSVDDLLRNLGLPRLREVDDGIRVTDAAEPLDKSVFRLGSYTVGELAYLAGCGSGSIYRWSNKINALKPDKVEGFSYWGFNQLVAFRFYYWLKSNVTSRVKTDVLGGLAEFAGREEEGTVAVTQSGDVYVEEDDSLHSITSGQEAIPDVLRLDQSFQRFELGGGATLVPNLLRPTSETRVHPAILGGTPSLRRHRIGCAAVARLVYDQNRAAASEAYPMLQEVEMSHAIEVGEQILALR